MKTYLNEQNPKSYNNFPFTELTPDFKEKYAELLDWHDNILDGLYKETLQELIDDYANGKTSVRKTAESDRNIGSFLGFHREVFSPRFALNLCKELHKKSLELNQDLESFFDKPEEVNILLEDYETYLSLRRNTKDRSSTDEKENLESRIVSRAISLFGIPHHQTLESKLADKGYEYAPKKRVLISLNEDTDLVVSCLKVLNELFTCGLKPVKPRNDKAKGFCTISNIENNSQTIATLIKLAFPDDVYHIAVGLDYVEFAFNKKRLFRPENSKSRFYFVTSMIFYLIEEKLTEKDIRQTYTERKSQLISVSKNSHNKSSANP